LPTKIEIVDAQNLNFVLKFLKVKRFELQILHIWTKTFIQNKIFRKPKFKWGQSSLPPPPRPLPRRHCKLCILSSRDTCYNVLRSKPMTSVMTLLLLQCRRRSLIRCRAMTSRYGKAPTCRSSVT